MISALAFFRRPTVEPEPELDEDELDVPTYLRRQPRPRALEWTCALPTREGFWHAKLPGAAGFTIVQVAYDAEGVLVYGIPAVSWRPVVGSELEWSSSPIQAPHHS